jgi:hypothetical protein
MWCRGACTSRPPLSFDDAFEGSITDAQIARRRAQHVRLAQDQDVVDRSLASASQAFAELRRFTKISCWHAAEHENAAMWERYLPKGACGVAVRSTVGSLKSALLPFRLDPSYGEEGIPVRRVRYLDYSEAEFEDRSMEAPFFYKRIEFRDEQEVRAVLSLRMAEEFGVPVPAEGVFVGVDPRELIDEVRVSAECTTAEAEHVKELLEASGVTCRVAPSTLSRRPVY